MNAYFDAMRRYATFRGRSTRSQFWLFTLVFTVLMAICFSLDMATGIGSEEALPITGLCYALHLIPTLAVTVRRLHDTDRSGWWLLLLIVPLVGQVVIFVFTCQASTAGAGSFGYTDTGRLVEAAQRPAMADLRVPQPSTIDRIEKLAALRASGTIDEAEFQRLKAEVMQPGTA